MRYREFKSTLLEVNMSPSSLQTWLQSPASNGMTMGFEAEMCVPCQTKPPQVNDIEDIIEFFSKGDFKLEVAIGKALASMYKRWVNQKYNNYLSNNPDFKYDIEERVFKELAKEYGEDEAYEMIDYESPEFEKMNEKVVADHKVYFSKLPIHSTASWLKALDVRTMIDMAGLDIGNKQVLTLPPEYDPLFNLLDDFKSAVNTKVVNTYSIFDPADNTNKDYSNWIIEPDVTIKPTSKLSVGMEFVSPVKSISESLSDLENTIAWAKNYGCTTNESTGLHINVSVPNYNRTRLDYIKLALFLGDQYILNQFNRLYNSQCVSVLQTLRDNSNQLNDSNLLNQMRQHMTTEISRLFHNSITEKYVSINAKDGWVEFRGPGGDYLNHNIHSLTNVALRTAMALQIACNEELYRKEYLRKLYTLIDPSLGVNAIDLFAKFAANELSKSELKTLIKELKKVKEIEKQDDPVPPISKQPLPIYNTTPQT